MKFTLELLESNSQISKQILLSIKNHIDKTINICMSRILTEIKNAVSDALRSEPEYSSLTSGQLKAEFGIANSSDIDTVIELIVDTIEVKNQSTKITNNGLTGGFYLTMLESDTLSDIITQNPALVKDDKGYTLPWLEWLCLRNNEPIVQNYSVKYGSSSRSRSGMAIMIGSDKNWRVPPAFAGSKSNNWTTRAISRAEQTIYDIIIKNIEGSL